jgi:hypothetical protein
MLLLVASTVGALLFASQMAAFAEAEAAGRERAELLRAYELADSFRRTGDYEQADYLFDKFAPGAYFHKLYAPSQLPDTPIKVRVPIVFRDSYTESSWHREDGGQISPDRLQPPFLKLPGFKLCYEGTADDPTEDAKLPYYCYLAALPARAGDAERTAAELRAQLAANFKDTPTKWLSVDVKTPDGTVLPWKMIRVVAEQPFRVESHGQITSKNLPGMFELWLHDANEYVVLIGWRTPTSILGRSAAREDLTWMPSATAGTVTY